MAALWKTPSKELKPTATAPLGHVTPEDGNAWAPVPCARFERRLGLALWGVLLGVLLWLGQA